MCYNISRFVFKKTGKEKKNTMINLSGIKIDARLLVIDNTKDNMAYSVNFKENQFPIRIEPGKLPDDRIANADIETVDAISFNGCCMR